MYRKEDLQKSKDTYREVNISDDSDKIETKILLSIDVENELRILSNADKKNLREVIGNFDINGIGITTNDESEKGILNEYKENVYKMIVTN